MALVSVGVSANNISDILDQVGVQLLQDLSPDALLRKNTTKIFVNGNWVGIHRDADYMLNELKRVRRNYTMPREISIVRDITTKEIKIFTDPGRVQRPLFIVENNKLLLKKRHIKMLLQTPIFELLI